MNSSHPGFFIVGILDSDGNEVVQYAYDAWGNCKTTVLDTTHEAIAELNPFRYRSYYYDTETHLYYLNTRYYDSEVGRFISQDDVSYLDPEHINGLNLYAYCGNNPVMRTDSQGTNWWTDFWNSVAGKVIGTILVLTVVIALSIATAGVGTAITTALGGGFVASVIGGAVAGAVSGAIIGAGFSLVGQGLISGYGNISWTQVCEDALKGAITGAIAGGVMGGIKFLLSASKIAKGISGLKTAQDNFDKAAQLLQETPINIKNGVMSTERIAAQLSFDTASVALEHAKSVYNCVEFLVNRSYFLAKLGLNQLVGGLIF